MTATDQLLERIVRDWASSNAVTVSVTPETRGGPAAFEVQPRADRGAPISLWVADDDESVSISVGGGLDFDAAIPLEASAVCALLTNVAAGHVDEYILKLFGRVVARSGSVGVPGPSQLIYGAATPRSIIPGVKWQRLGWTAYQ